jgi:hypothetical protein
MEKLYEKVINEHCWQFEIYGDANESKFIGRAKNDEPCFITGFGVIIGTEKNKHYSTTEDVEKFLIEEINKKQSVSSYIHPKGQSGTCTRCKRRIQPEDGWTEVRSE